MSPAFPPKPVLHVSDRSIGEHWQQGTRLDRCELGSDDGDIHGCVKSAGTDLCDVEITPHKLLQYMMSAPANHQDDLLRTAKEILSRTSYLSQQLSQSLATPPISPRPLANTNSNLWNSQNSQILALRSSILALTQRLDKLLEGPHGFLHEYVSINWEHGALYALLEFNVLEKMPLGGSPVSAVQLATSSGLPPDKLLRICRLVATAGILHETEEGFFAHTAISEILVKDEGYKSFIRFQLFETRVASAHLADSLKTPFPFWIGQSAFEHAWGVPLYEWHAQHPEKGKRFGQAMQRVSQDIDEARYIQISIQETA
ncbi:MAG: hypothetical protein Q9219_007057 [cf. Caloplaca sp. 3 TL-2023]